MSGAQSASSAALPKATGKEEQASDLEAIIQNIAERIYLCEEGLNIFLAVSRHAKAINESTFNHLFGRLQDRAATQLFLDVPKVASAGVVEIQRR